MEKVIIRKTSTVTKKFIIGAIALVLTVFTIIKQGDIAFFGSFYTKLIPFNQSVIAYINTFIMSMLVITFIFSGFTILLKFIKDRNFKYVSFSIAKQALYLMIYYLILIPTFEKLFSGSPTTIYIVLGIFYIAILFEINHLGCDSYMIIKKDYFGSVATYKQCNWKDVEYAGIHFSPAIGRYLVVTCLMHEAKLRKVPTKTYIIPFGSMLAGKELVHNIAGYVKEAKPEVTFEDKLASYLTQ